MRITRGHMPLLVVLLLLGDAALAAAYWADVLLGRPRPKVTELFDLNGEGNLPAWFSSMQLFTIAILLASFAARRAQRASLVSLCLYALPAIFVAMSMDEIAQIHERLGNHSDALLPGGWRGDTIFARTGIWMFVIGGPFIAGLAVLLYLIRHHLREVPRSLGRFTLGMALFLGGSLVVEALTNFITPGTRLDHLQVLVEESLKLLGETIVVWAAYDLALAPAAAGAGITARLTAGLALASPEPSAPAPVAPEPPLRPVVRPLKAAPRPEPAPGSGADRS